jgi:hypothetical protein
MASSLHISPVVRPAVLTGLSNGLLPAHVLVDVPGGRLIEPAARAWRAMVAAAAVDGIELKPTSTVDTYRSFSVQERTFLARYATEPTGRTPQVTRTWQGRTWYLKVGVAPSASPGSSNHGWGLAVDVHTASGVRLDWLSRNAMRFGWSWELLPAEPWHIRYVAGDRTPQAVIDHETSAPAAPCPTPAPAPAPAAPRYPGTPVKQGSKGEAVRHIQRKVGARVDGDFGPATHRTVVAWQQARHLKADGIVGPVTWRALFGAL